MILGHYLLPLHSLLLAFSLLLRLVFSLFSFSSLLLTRLSPVQSRAIRAPGRKSRTNHKPRQTASEPTLASYRVNRREQKSRQAGERAGEPGSHAQARRQGRERKGKHGSRQQMGRWTAQSSAVSDNLP